jgi:hypothetical protein
MLADANVYLCEAGPVGSVGCEAMKGDQSVVYPVGCQLVLPTVGTFCTQTTCNCQEVPIAVPTDAGTFTGDSSLEFACGL